MNIIVWPAITFTFSCMRLFFICSTEVIKNLITSFGNTVISNASKTGERNGKSTRGKKKKSWWNTKFTWDNYIYSDTQNNKSHQDVNQNAFLLCYCSGSRPLTGKGQVSLCYQHISDISVTSCHFLHARLMSVRINQGLVECCS